MVIESFLLSGVMGNSILSELNHFFYSFFAFGLTSIVTLHVAAKAERIELTLCENIAFSGGEIIPDRPPFVEIDPDDVPITN